MMGALTSEATLRDSEEAVRRAFTALSVGLSSGQEPPEAYTVSVGRHVFRVEVVKTEPLPHVEQYDLGACYVAATRA